MSLVPIVWGQESINRFLRRRSMERKPSCVRVRYGIVLWGVLTILLCAVPCGARDVASGETLNVGTGKDVNEIPTDWLDVYGTVNMYPGAYVGGGIYAWPGSTVNIYAGDVGAGSVIAVYSGANVTVYGTDFAVDDVLLDPNATQFTVDPYNGGVLTGTYENDSSINLKFFSEIPVNIVNTASGGPEPIDIDIKPGSYPNAINLGSSGVIPVAILSSESLDATSLPAENVFLAGAGVAVRGKGSKYLASQEDVNGDDLLDLVVKVETENLEPGTFQDGKAVLRVHETSDQTSAVLYEGSDDITIVPPE
jgi:hypothetical protein